MKIEVTNGPNNYEGYQSYQHIKVTSNSKETELWMYNLNDCPEDACFERDLVDSSDIVRFMEIAYEAGKNGEKLELEYIDSKD